MTATARRPWILLEYPQAAHQQDHLTTCEPAVAGPCLIWVPDSQDDRVCVYCGDPLEAHAAGDPRAGRDRAG
jgi:hypothetical protein